MDSMTDVGSHGNHSAANGHGETPFLEFVSLSHQLAELGVAR